MSTGTRAAQRILGELTLEEKLRLCTGVDFWHTFPVERLGVAAMYTNDGPQGVRATRSDAIMVTDNLPSTCFPTASALGASWDRDLVRKVAATIGVEARAHGVGLLLAPGLNLKRSPLGGRNAEYFSEDPVAAGQLGAAYVAGVQSSGVAACVKHFVCNDQERDRMTVNLVVGERTLREVYVRPFATVIEEADPAAVMVAYGRLNGERIVESPDLVRGLLREELGFDGLVVSDWGAVVSPQAAMHAGLDLEMPPSGDRQFRELSELHAGGGLPIESLDRRVLRILEIVLGVQSAEAPVDFDRHYAVAADAATRCVTLLSNDGTLPLSAQRPSLGVLGAPFEDPRIQGAGSSEVTPERVVSPAAAFADVAPDVDVEFLEAFGRDGLVDETAVDEALALVDRHDVTVVFVDLPPEAETEGLDREDLRPPAGALSFLERLADPRKVVLVIGTASPLIVPRVQQFAAVVHAGLLGAGVGDALASVIFGVVSPSGRTTETWPLDMRDLPPTVRARASHATNTYGEGVLVGHRFFDDAGSEVAFPFGHGLTYSAFAHDGLASDTNEFDGEAPISVRLVVSNTGGRAARAVPQLYIEPIDPTFVRPVRSLVAFDTVDLEPGEETTVVFTVGRSAFEHYDDVVGAYVVAPGRYRLHAGRSSRDLTGSVEVVARLSERDRAAHLAHLSVDSPGRDLSAIAEIASVIETELVGMDGPLREIVLDMPLTAAHRLFPDLVGAESIEMVGRRLAELRGQLHG